LISAHDLSSFFVLWFSFLSFFLFATGIGTPDCIQVNIVLSTILQISKFSWISTKIQRSSTYSSNRPSTSFPMSSRTPKSDFGWKSYAYFCELCSTYKSKREIFWRRPRSDQEQGEHDSWWETRGENRLEVENKWEHKDSATKLDLLD
jgi:hypothetical protein